MSTSDSHIILRAQEFLHTHARLLERRLAGAWFSGDDPAAAVAVLDALAAYRNADGGLGHALEPDVRAPLSQPLAVDFALETVEQVLESPAGGHARVRDAARAFAASVEPYLAAVAAPTGGLPIVFPSIARCPRADHWGDGRFPPGINPTAGIVARLRLLEVSTPWLDAAEAFCRKEIDALFDRDEFDAHAALNVLRFLESLGEDPWAAERTAQLAGRIGELSFFHLYPGAGYGLTPLDFAPEPENPRRALFPADAVEAHLDALAEGQAADGGWTVPWQPPGPAAELEWRGVVTVRAARVLTANGR
ncbi:hypothetical protein [Amycolatopsis anabasis]|uniref:hypothetical protein n=1 Tax=Amycolatopsis anabasis TaxID=1840409 RepID=UPI00131EAA24|nr:hypothetical protein [Amycolatopsis anabasis]